jgi:hypothetical protein
VGHSISVKPAIAFDSSPEFAAWPPAAERAGRRNAAIVQANRNQCELRGFLPDQFSPNARNGGKLFTGEAERGEVASERRHPPIDQEAGGAARMTKLSHPAC